MFQTTVFPFKPVITYVEVKIIMVF